MCELNRRKHFVEPDCRGIVGVVGDRNNTAPFRDGTGSSGDAEEVARAKVAKHGGVRKGECRGGRKQRPRASMSPREGGVVGVRKSLTDGHKGETVERRREWETVANRVEGHHAVGNRESIGRE